MDFAFTDEQRMIWDTVRGFFAEAATSERTRVVMSATGADAGFDRDLWSALAADLGLVGVGVPEEFGGAGLGMVEFALVAEAAGAQIAGIPLLGHAMAGRAITVGGSQAQKAKWLPQLAAGGLVCTSSWEPAVTFEAGAVSGTVPYMAHGSAADLLLIYSADEAWIIDLNGDGVTVTGQTTMDQTRPFATAILANVKAEPLANGRTAVNAALSAGWICLAAEALGGAQASLDRTVAYARERVQFGRSIGSFQAYKHRLADMMIEIEQARSAVYWAACAVDECSDEARLALHSAKSFCADTFAMCAANMIQLHGGIGFTWEHDAHLFFKRARSIQTLLGDGPWHREQIARLVIGEAA